MIAWHSLVKCASCYKKQLNKHDSYLWVTQSTVKGLHTATQEIISDQIYFCSGFYYWCYQNVHRQHICYQLQAIKTNMCYWIKN